MKKLLLAFLFLSLLSCEDDSVQRLSETNCNCYYTLVEGSQEQANWTEPSDTTDCDLDGVKVYYPGWENSTVYYRVLHCNQTE